MSLGQKEPDARYDKRDAILKAAWGLIRHYGYGKTTIDDIAKRAGVGKGTVYLYFRSKVEIMLALTELTNDRISADLERIAKGEGSPEERLRACLMHRILTLFDIVQKSPHGAEIISSMLPEIVERLDRYVRAHGVLLAGILREGVASGEMSVENPDAAGRLLAELFEFLTPPYYRFKTRRSLEKFANETLDLVLAGLRSRAAAGMKRAAEG
ncbi:MAG: TetR/AcrR family transcriptional regulator [Deltaproteobacteria bacterium]|nr:TetR/AcrR family transcriptional regulator [Deltaproteobacteria bacterium]